MKALLTPFAPSLAHVSRCLAVAEAWRDRGHTAIFAVGDERTALVQTAGFQVYPVPEVSGAVFRTDQGFQWLTLKYLAQNLAADQSILTQAQPDVVVFDFRFTAALSAHRFNRPAVGILHGNALELVLHPQEAARRLMGEPQPAHGATALRVHLMQRIFPLAFQTVMRRVAGRLNPILKANGHSPIHSPFELLLGDANLVADIPELLSTALPSHSHLVGPLMWSGWEQSAPWLDQLGDRPLIYVTMGSTVEAQAVLIKIIEALRAAAYNVVVSTGGLSLSVELPAHIHVFPTVPGAAVMRRSSVVIHHGGHETLMQALAAGVPSLVFPANPDQVLVAQQIQALGIGASFWRTGNLPIGSDYVRQLTAAEIKRAVDDLVADVNFKRRCQALGEKMRNYHGAAMAAEAVEKIVSDGQSGCRLSSLP